MIAVKRLKVPMLQERDKCVFRNRTPTVGERGNKGAVSCGSGPFEVVKDVAGGGAADYQVRIRALTDE